MEPSLVHAAFVEAGVHKDVIPRNRRRILHALPGTDGPMSLKALVEASMRCSVSVFQDREPGPDRGTFYMDAEQSVPSELEPFLSPTIASAEKNAKITEKYHRLWLAGAAAGVGGPIGSRAIATPVPEQDREGYEIVRRRLSSVSPSVRDNVVQLTQQMAENLPKELAAPFHRTINLIQSLLPVRQSQQNRSR